MKKVEKYSQHIVGGTIAVIILIMSSKPASAARTAVQGFKAGAFG